MKTLARVLVYAAVAGAIYAVLMHLASVVQNHFGTVLHHGDSASGTYVNRNHFAGFLEMSLAIGIGVLYKRRTAPIATTMLLTYGAIGLASAAVRSALTV